VVIDERVFVNTAENVTARDVVADLELGGVEIPSLFSAERFGVDTAYSCQQYFEAVAMRPA
jgi:hypothetical protein